MKQPLESDIDKHLKTPSGMEIGDAIAQILKQIRAAETCYHRAPGSVSLLAVSKTKPIGAILAAIHAGQRAFGENYVDEALEKISKISEQLPDDLQPPCEWHFIGAIQSNKTRQLAAQVDWVHAIDREKIARRLSDHRPADKPPLNCCIQLNLDQEQSKAGVSVSELPALCELITQLPGLTLRGLMIIPAPRETVQEQREIFARVRELFESQRQLWPSMDTLSMGMSNDLDAAIAEGSTMVRVGTAVFGARDRSN